MTSRLSPYVVRLPNMGKHLYPPPLTPIAAPEFKRLLSGRPRKGSSAHLYLHFPFCETICTFCVLHKYQLRPESPVREYIEALKMELRALSRLPLIQELRFTSIYFGGGTPSVTEDRYLAEVMDVVTSSFHLDNPQITFEGHVSSLTRDKIRFVRTLGVNRISTGVQTFHPKLRRMLNLQPTEDDIQRCAGEVRAAGFDDFNVDIMYNLPGQTSAIFEQDLLKTVALNPSGVDVYETVVTRRTGLSRQIARDESLVEFDAARLTDNYLLSEQILREHGYRQRNIHVWDRPGYENRLVGQQNLLRDHDLSLIGAGLSAYSFVNGMPFINVTGLKQYIERAGECGHGVEAYHVPTRSEEMERFMTLSLQTIDFDRASFSSLFGRDMNDVFRPQVSSFLRRGLMEATADGYRLTAMGRAWASTMTMEFFGKKILEDFIRTRLNTAGSPGYMADVTQEEMYEFVVFALFHPEIMIQGVPNIRLMRAYVRHLMKNNSGWLRKVSTMVLRSFREYGLPPLGWYSRSAGRLLRHAVGGGESPVKGFS